MALLKQRTVATPPVTLTPHLWKRYMDVRKEKKIIFHCSQIKLMPTGEPKTHMKRKKKVIYLSLIHRLWESMRESMMRQWNGWYTANQLIISFDWYINHTLQNKLSVIRTLLQTCFRWFRKKKTRTVMSITAALKTCGYPCVVDRKVKDGRRGCFFFFQPEFLFADKENILLLGQRVNCFFAQSQNHFVCYNQLLNQINRLSSSAQDILMQN